MKFPLTKTGYVLAVLLGAEIIAGLSSHLVLFLLNPKMLSDGQYGLAVGQLAGCGLWGGIGIVFLIRYFDRRITSFAKTALEILILYCMLLLAIVIAAEYLKLGKSVAIEYTVLMILCFLASPLMAALVFFQLPILVIPTLALFPYTFIITATYLYLKISKQK